MMYKVGGFILSFDQVAQLAESVGVKPPVEGRAIFLNRMFRKKNIKYMKAVPMDYPIRCPNGVYGTPSVMLATHSMDDPDASWTRFEPYQEDEKVDRKVREWLERNGLYNIPFDTVTDPSCKQVNAHCPQ